jgi:hypothetical protein
MKNNPMSALNTSKSKRRRWESNPPSLKLRRTSPRNNGFAKSNQTALSGDNINDLQNSQNQTDTKTDSLPIELKELINAWPKLSDNIRQAIKVLIK